MTQYYLAVDIGASSGRHILGHIENNKMKIEEVHRFSNQMIDKNGHKVWDVDRLWQEIKKGMQKCKQRNKIPISMGIDTWGVDFVLLDAKGKRLGEAVAYRDERTEQMPEAVYRKISEADLYAQTGIQKQSFNSIYQLMAVSKQQPQILAQARKFLMLPDYFHYLLTGIAAQEYTNATTTQLVDPITKQWKWELIRTLGFPETIFQEIVTPGTRLGQLTEQVRAEVGFLCEVVLPATHDTGSAVVAVPTQVKSSLYLSSGTWSLMGTELAQPDCTAQSRRHNFSNEGGYEYRFRYLKNIMGLWMIQSLKKEIGQQLSFVQIGEMAAGCSIQSIIDVNDKRFLAPENMTSEIQLACRESRQSIPQGIAELARVVYKSLADCYAKVMTEIEDVTGVRYDGIHVIGGGAEAEYLNRLTAATCRRRVLAGPKEATAIGNITVQMLAHQQWDSLVQARACIYQSFPVKKYDPAGSTKQA